MKKLMISVILISLMLFGCASTKWCKPGATQADFERDKYDCQKKTRTSNPGIVPENLEPYFNCMKIEKGWSKCTE